MNPQLTFYLFAVIGLIYLISPFDLLPEALTGIFGYVDDIAVLVILYWRYSVKLKQYQEQVRFYREKLKSFRERQDGTSSDRPKSEAASDPYSVLEISRSADKEEIDRAFKRLIALYHPDKVAHLGKELQALAHQKTIEIKQAYDNIKG